MTEPVPGGPDDPGGPNDPVGPAETPDPGATAGSSPAPDPVARYGPGGPGAGISGPGHRPLDFDGNDPGSGEPALALPGRIRRRRRRASRRRRIIGRTLLAVGVFILLAAAWVGWRTFQAYRALNQASDQVSALQGALHGVADIDVPGARASVALLQVSTASAVSATTDPFYRFAGLLPVVGANLRAVGTIAGTVDDVARTTAPELLDAATTVTPAAMVPVGGRIPLDPLISAGAGLQRADDQVAAAQSRIGGVNRSRLIGPIGQAVDTLADKLGTLRSTTASAARIARLGPPMLGATAPRKYLVVFQNLAEPRATGGIFGSYAVLEADRGKLSVSGQGASSRRITPFDPPLPLPPLISPALYGTLPGVYPTDVNLVPDYPTAAALFARMYQLREGTAVDGVLAIDPVALGYLLAGSKPIDIGRGQQLTATSISRVLLSTAYQLFPTAGDAPERDSFVSDATTKAFAAVTGAPNDPAAELKGLTRAADERRLLLFSTRPAEQTDLAQTDLSGALGDDSDAPTVGVFRDDATGGKLGYYATGSAKLTGDSCQNPAGAMDLRVTMGSTAPTGGLSPYVLGLAKAGPYVLRTNVLLVGPVGGRLTDIQLAGSAVPVAGGEQNGRPVAMVTVDLPPGAGKDITAKVGVRADSTATATPRLLLTPGVHPWPTTTDGFGVCHR